MIFNWKFCQKNILSVIIAECIRTLGFELAVAAAVLFICRVTWL